MMATIRIRLVTSACFVADSIRTAQLGYPYTHAEAEVPGGYIGAHARGGVAMRAVGYDAAPGMVERFFALKVTDEQAASFHAYIAAQLGKPYDFAAIADFVGAVFVHHVSVRPAGAWLEPNAWFCSELIATALIHAGIFPKELAADARHVTPQNLAFALSVLAKRILDPIP